MTGQTKMTETNDKQKNNKNDKIFIFMYPSVCLQVFPGDGAVPTGKSAYKYLGKLGARRFCTCHAKAARA